LAALAFGLAFPFAAAALVYLTAFAGTDFLAAGLANTFFGDFLICLVFSGFFAYLG
jgi:hypothetical protein